MSLNVEAIKSFWIAEADDALRVADHLMEKEDHSYALFFGHLALEKLLKALCVEKRKDHAPPIHNLVRLAKVAGIDLDDDTETNFLIITAFNIEARYPDFKQSFRKKCTKDYAENKMILVKRKYEWLKSYLR